MTISRIIKGVSIGLATAYCGQAARGPTLIAGSLPTGWIR